MTDIKLISQDHWVIIRWHKGFRCGPLSRTGGCLGYHEGYVGVLALFDSHTEALEAASRKRWPDAEHTAARLRDLRFRLRSNFQSSINITGDYQTVLQAFALATMTYPDTVLIIEEVVGEWASPKQLKVVQ